MHWLPLALYLFWGPLVLWGIVVTALFLSKGSAQTRISVLSLAGSIMGSAAVTVGWELTGWFGSEISNGLWFVMIASWLALLTPLAGLVGLLGIYADLNYVHLHQADIAGEGFAMAIIATTLMLLNIVLPVAVGHGGKDPGTALTKRLLTLRISGILKMKRKSWG